MLVRRKDLTGMFRMAERMQIESIVRRRSGQNSRSVILCAKAAPRRLDIIRP